MLKCLFVGCKSCKMYGMFYINDKPAAQFLYTETIKLYCTILYCKIIAMKTTPLVSPLFSERETERPDVQGQCISQSVI